MGTMASQITSHTIVYSMVYSRPRSKKTSKLCVTGLCVGNSPGTGEFPAQRASNVENDSIWCHHHVVWISCQVGISHLIQCTCYHFVSNFELSVGCLSVKYYLHIGQVSWQLSLKLSNAFPTKYADYTELIFFLFNNKQQLPEKTSLFLRDDSLKSPICVSLVM